MDTKQLTTALDRIYNQEDNRIVFWHDPEREFLDFIDANSLLQFGDTAVQVVRLDKVGSFATKMRLEREDPPDATCCTLQPKSLTMTVTGC